MNIKRIDLNNLRASPAHVPMFRDIVEKKTVIEDDFHYLSKFKGQRVFVVDIGANIGAFSIAAINLIGSVNTVAFEPNVSLKWFLDQTKSIYSELGRRFEYNLVGLSDEENTIDLYIPLIDDWHVVGEASMDRSVFDRDFVKARLKTYSTGGTFDLDVASVQVKIFDSLQIEPPAGTQVNIVKIDVENYEPYVLRGMKSYIEKNRPVIIAENSKPETITILSEHGYLLYSFDRGENSLKSYDGSRGDNIIYVHSDVRDKDMLAVG